MSEQVPFRIDFLMEVISSDKENNEMHIKMIPDPKRYDEFEKDGKRFYKDKFLEIVFDSDLIAQMAEKSRNIPIFHSPPQIEDAASYITERKEAVKTELETKEHQKPRNTPLQHIPINAGASSKEVVFVSVDICKSTELRAKNGNKYDEALKIFFSEMGIVVGQFNGSMHKLTGDGFIAYIEDPSFNLMCDNAVNLCVTLRCLLNESINAVFKEKGLPVFNIRIGAEYGTAKIQKYVVPSTGFEQTDVTSDALNRAVKIQESAPANKIFIGENLYKNIHVNWLIRCASSNVNLGKEVGLSQYSVYEIN